MLPLGASFATAAPRLKLGITYGRAPYRVVYVSAHAQEERKMIGSTKPRSALVVVDAQVGVLESIWDSKRIVGNIETLVQKARSSGTPVLWVQHSDVELKYGSAAWEFAPNSNLRRVNLSYTRNTTRRSQKLILKSSSSNLVSNVSYWLARLPTGACVRLRIPPLIAATT